MACVEKRSGEFPGSGTTIQLYRLSSSPTASWLHSSYSSTGFPCSLIRVRNARCEGHASQHPPASARFLAKQHVRRRPSLAPVVACETCCRLWRCVATRYGDASSFEPRIIVLQLSTTRFLSDLAVYFLDLFIFCFQNICS